MFVTNWILALTAIGATVIGFLLMSLITSRSQKYFIRQQKHLGELNGHIEEIYAGHTVVKAYNGEEKSQAEFDRMNAELQKSGFKAQCMSGMMMPLMTFIGNLGYVAVCVVGAALALKGKISFGTIIAFTMYVRYFTQPLSQMAQSVQSLQSAAAAGERVFEFLEAEELEDESDKIFEFCDIKGKVEFDHVKFGYEDSDRIIIKDEVERRLTDSLEAALKLAEGLVEVEVNGAITLYSTKYSCPDCDISIEELQPRMFFF